jgi:hypothetical protein
MLIIDIISTNLVLASPCVLILFQLYRTGSLGTSNSEVRAQTRNTQARTSVTRMGFEPAITVL